MFLYKLRHNVTSRHSNASVAGVVSEDNNCFCYRHLSINVTINVTSLLVVVLNLSSSTRQVDETLGIFNDQPTCPYPVTITYFICYLYATLFLVSMI